MPTYFPDLFDAGCSICYKPTNSLTDKQAYKLGTSVFKMRPFNTLALGLLGAVVASASDVESLTKDTFPDFVKDNDLVLAECKLLSVHPRANSY